MALCADCDEITLGEQELAAVRLNAERIASVMARSGLPKAYANGTRTLASVRDRAGVLLANELLDKKISGLFLFGGAGPDKTTLACAFLADWIRRGGTGRYDTMCDVMSDLQSSYREGAELTRNMIVDPLISAQALVLDELGKEKASDHAAGVIFQVLDARYRLMRDGVSRPTVLLSNYSLDDLCARFPTKEIADPIRRRISEMTEALHMS